MYSHTYLIMDQNKLYLLSKKPITPPPVPAGSHRQQCLRQDMGATEEAGHIFKGKRASLPFAESKKTSKKLSTRAYIISAIIRLLAAFIHRASDVIRGSSVWDKERQVALQHPPSGGTRYQIHFFLQKRGVGRKLLTRTRLLTAACTAATGAVRSGMAFPSTSPSSCIITRWDIC